METVQIVRDLDLSGLVCPIPVMRTSKEIKEVSVGEAIKIIATDPVFEIDLTAWTVFIGHELLSLTRDGGKFIAVVKRSK